MICKFCGYNNPDDSCKCKFCGHDLESTNNYRDKNGYVRRFFYSWTLKNR